ncbi:MAG: hypothetical protein U0Q15_15140 [Kineosporiaceae bacterium]
MRRSRLPVARAARSVVAVAMLAGAAVTAAPSGAADATTPFALPSLIRGVHVNDVARSFALASGQGIQVLFTAVPGQAVTASVTASTDGSSVQGCPLVGDVLDPAGQRIAARQCVSGTITFPTAIIRGTGLHRVVLRPAPGTSATVSVGVRATGPATITPNIGPRTVTVPARGVLDLAYRMECSVFGLVEIGRRSPGGRDTAAVVRPDGTALGQATDHVTTSMSGVHQVRLTNPGTAALTVPVHLSKGRDVVRAVPADGTPVDVALPLKGQQARLTFAATAGQRVVATVTDRRFNGDPAIAPAGRLIGPDGRTWGTLDLRGEGESSALVATTGTQTLVVDPVAWTTGSLRIALHLVADPEPVPATPGTLARPGPATTLTASTPWTNPTLKFKARHHQRYLLQMTSDVDAVVRWRDASGAEEVLGTVSPRYGFGNTLIVEHTGTQTVILDPIGAGTGSAQAHVNLDRDDGIVLGQARTVKLETEETVTLFIDPEVSQGQVLTYRVTDNLMGPLLLRLGDVEDYPSIEVPRNSSSGTLPPIVRTGVETLTVSNRGVGGTITLLLTSAP